MSFKGDLSTIGLAEVFQMISMSQKEGTLIVKDHDSRKSIYFGPNGVRLLSTGRRKGHRLGDMLLRAGKVTQEQIDNALENSRIQKRMLGEILVEAGAVTEPEIDQVVREQIEEEIYDLFLWRKADFEFIEGPPGEGLTDADSNVTRLAFDVNGLLLEAVRRADEWSVINQQVPSLDSVFVFVSESDRNEEDKVAPDALKRVYRLIDGQRTLSEIVDNSGVGKFEVCKGVVDLLQRGRLRLLTVQEMMELASRTKSSGAKEKALRMFVAVAAQAPGDGKIVAGVARVLEGEGLAREAAIHHARAGKAYLEAGEADRALDHYKKALQLSPEDTTIREGLFEVYAAQGNLDEGKTLAREIVGQALMTPDYPKAQQFCDRIVAADPADMDFRILRARVYHRSGQKRELEAELEHVRKNLPADPRELERLEKELQEFTARAPTRSTTVPGKSPKTSRSRARAGARRVLWIAAAVVLPAAGGSVGYELKARGSLQAALATAEGLAAREQFQQAREAIDGWRGSVFRFSPWQSGRAAQELSRLEERRAEWERERAQREEKRRGETLERLRQQASRIEVLRRTDPSQALALARDLRAQAEAARDADLVRRAEELAASLDKYVADALQLKVKADELEKLGKVRDAAVMIDRLLLEFPNTDAARAALFPLEIVTRPPGVRVTSMRNDLFIGETGAGPLKHRIRPGEPVKLRFEKDGYVTRELDVKDKTVGRIDMHLVEKKYDWAKPLGISVTGEPVMNGEVLFVADGSRLYALQTAPFRLLWSESLSGTVAGSPRPAGQRIIVGTGSRSVIALDPGRPGNRVVWRVELPDRVSASPGASPDGTAIYIGTGDGQLRGMRAADGEELWKAPLPAEICQEPLSNGTVVVAACADGTVVAYKAATGEEAWRLRADGPLGPAILNGTAIYAPASDQHLYAIDVNRGQRLWRRLLPSQVTGRVAKVGETVVAAARDGRVYFLSAATGETVGTFDDPQGPIQGGVTTVGPLAVFGSDDQWLYAYDVGRQDLAWRLRSNGRIRLAPVQNGNRILFTSEDNLYSVALD